MENITIENLYDLTETIAAELFTEAEYPWEVLPRIHDFILELGKRLPEEIYEKRGEDIWVAKNAKVAPTACLNGPLIIDEEAEIRHCAFVRGNAIVGKGAVVGNSTELKNVVLFNKVQVPHYNYVGDSVLGFKSHMGAGSITSNVKSDKTLVVVKNGEEKIETGLKKMGAMLGDTFSMKKCIVPAVVPVYIYFFIENVNVGACPYDGQQPYINGSVFLDLHNYRYVIIKILKQK